MSGPAEGSGPSRAVEDYLKAVYKLQGDVGAVSTTALAEELERSAASVTNMVKALAENGLVEHTPYRGVRLTASGELTALRIIRRHRVLELYLIEKLGFSWEDVHAEAERLEHAASDALIDRMARALGEPSVDPHGSPIPTRTGEIAETAWIALGDLEDGCRGTVREVSDDSAEALRRLADLGLFPGTEIRMVGGRPDGGTRLEVEGEAVDVERGLAETVFVEPEGT
ncbi:MAG: metal-dependent transcriptional regulator [Gemmatimonadota bacterium]|nr:metal-dependent transcriptional regulator [Gemmatimonadota bacterium]